MLLLKFYFN